MMKGGRHRRFQLAESNIRPIHPRLFALAQTLRPAGVRVEEARSAAGLFLIIARFG